MLITTKLLKQLAAAMKAGRFLRKGTLTGFSNVGVSVAK